MEFWRRNWGYKLVSLFLAILLWLSVSNQMRTGNAQQVIPLQERGAPSNLVVTSTLLSTVTVRLQGAVNPSLVKDMVAYVDLSGAVKGEESYPVVVPVPSGVKVLSVEPSNVTVDLDVLKEKAFQVSFQSQGQAGSGYDVGKPIIRPNIVTVRGPEEKLSQINQVFVEVNLANATDTIQTSAAVRFQDASGNPISGPDPTRPVVMSQPQEVSVVIPVYKKELASRTVPVKAATKGNPAPGLMVSQIISSPAAVTIFGPPDKLKGIDSLNGGTVDITGANQDVAVDIKPENLGLPTGVSLEPGIKISVIVRLGAAPIQRTIQAVPVTVKNLPANEQAELSSTAIDVAVKGPPDIVNALKASDLILWVDLSGLGPGEQSVQVFAQLPSGVDAPDLPKITVNIKAQ